MKQAVWKPEGAGLRRRVMGSVMGKLRVMKTRCQHRHRMRLEADVQSLGKKDGSARLPAPLALSPRHHGKNHLYM